MFRSVRSRLVLSFALIVTVTLLAAGIALITRLTGYREDLNASTLRQVAAPIYYNLTFFTPRLSTAQSSAELRAELMEYIRAQEEAGVTVLLLGADGRPLPQGASDPDLLDEQFEVPPAPLRGVDFAALPEGSHVTSDGEALQYVTVPMPRYVRADNAGLYAIVVALPRTERSAIWGELAPRLLFAGIIGAGAAVIAAMFLWGSLFRGLRKVTAAIRAVSAGDYRQRVPETGPTEVRELARDVNRMADSVQSSQVALREFVANVSHELKTPLTSIRGFAESLVDGTMESPEERARAVRVIDAESRRVLQLVSELLDLARIEAGQREMHLSPVDAAVLLAHVRDVFAVRAQQAGVRIDVESDGVVAIADFDRIEQVLANLVDNALRHTRTGGSLELAAATGSSGMAEFRVTDSGEGISEEDAARVFDRFYRSSIGEPDMPGAGLGLAIAREIVRAHGGTIAASPRRDGLPGTRFTFTLPSASSRAEPAMDAPSSTPVETEGLQPGGA